MNEHKTKANDQVHKWSRVPTTFLCLNRIPQSNAKQIGFSFKGKFWIERVECFWLYTLDWLTLLYGVYQLPNVASVLYLPSDGATSDISGTLEGKSSRQVVLAAASALLENSLMRAGLPQPVSLLAGFTKIDTEPKLALHAIWQADKSREELLRQGMMTLIQS